MITISPDTGVCFDATRCQQCGACVAVCPVNALSAAVTDHSTGLVGIHVDRKICVRCGKCAAVCPAVRNSSAKGYPERLKFLRYSLSHNSDPTIRREASSGGVVRTLIVEALRSGAVDGVYALGRKDTFPYVEGRFWHAVSPPGYGELPNSVYHPVMQCAGLSRVPRCRRLMIVGTSCQITALREALRGRYEELISVVIFCKQQKHLGATRFISKICGAGSLVPEFKARYRGEGWPGTVTINGHSIPYGRAAQIPFGRRLWSVPGCDICADPFGINAGADLTLMDPWEICKPGNEGDTLVAVISEAGKHLIENLPMLEHAPLTYEEALPALGLTDIRRKQSLVPYYRGESCTSRIRIAGYLDKIQRRMLGHILLSLPRLPMIVYRAMCKLPDPRNIIIR